MAMDENTYGCNFLTKAVLITLVWPDRWCPLGPSYSYNPTLKPVYPVQESCKTLVQASCQHSCCIRLRSSCYKPSLNTVASSHLQTFPTMRRGSTHNDDLMTRSRTCLLMNNTLPELSINKDDKCEVFSRWQ